MKRVVAKRRFILLGQQGRQRDAWLEIGAPYSYSETGEDYRCEFRVSGLGDEKIRYGDGVDSLQALLLAVNIAEAYIESAAHDEGVNVRWDAGEPGDLGIQMES